MSETRVTSAVYDLIAGLERYKKWIRRIGWTAILFPVVLLLVPVSFLIVGPIALILAIISLIGGVKILNFLWEWDRKYAALKQAEAELTKIFFPANQRFCIECGSFLFAGARFCRDCGHSVAS